MTTQGSAEQETQNPIASFFYFGEKIYLYNSQFPNFYHDQKGELWIPNQNESRSGQGTYKYKKASLATPEEIEIVKKMSIADMPGVFYDHRGERWIKTIDPITKEAFFIRMSEATEQDMQKVPQANSLTWMWWNQAKEFPEQSAKFAVAQFIVEMTACFGLNSLTFTNASSSNPACTTEFFQHVVDPKGMFGFYMFMVASGYTSETSMRIIELSHKLRGTGVSKGVLRAKFMPYLGYFGMVAGSLASSVTGHVLSNQNWTPCLAMIKTDGLSNEYCLKVITSFASDNEFWRNFGSSVPSLLLSSVAAHFTQQIIVKNYMSFTNSAALRSMNVRLLSASDDVLRIIARLGPRAVTGVRFVGGIVAGVPGVIIFVATEVGQFVGFLQFEQWFSLPIARAVNDYIETNKTNEGLEKIDFATSEAQKINWQRAISGPSNCRNIMTGPRQSKQVCDEEEVLPAGLALLKTGAQNFRKRVLLNQFEEANAKWSLKVSSFMTKYKATKLIIEHIYAHRQDVPMNMEMSLVTTAKTILSLWINALEIETPVEKKLEINELITEIANIAETIDSISPPEGAPLEGQPSFIDGLLLSLKPLEQLTGVLLPQKSSQEILLDKMLDFQKNSGRFIINLFPPGLGSNFCLSAPLFCTAFNTTQNIEFSKLPLNDSANMDESMQDTRDFIENLSGVFGPDVIKEILGNLLCNNSQQDFHGANLDNNGREAHFDSPFLLKLKGDDEQKYFQSNCSDSNGNRKFFLDINDFQRPWIVGNRVFSNPISLLVDKEQTLVLGTDLKSASSAWQTRAFPIASQFLKDMTHSYNEMLNDDLFPFVPSMSGAELLMRTRPQMRGPTLDYHITTIGQSKLWILALLPMGERPLLSESLLGQVTFLLEQIKYKAPDFNGRIPRGKLKSSKSELYDQLLEKFAEHIAGLNYQTDTSRIDSEWNKYENDIKYAGTNFDSIDKANTDFALHISQAAISPEKLSLIKQQRNEISALIDQLYEGLTNYRATLLTGMDAETYMEGMPLEEARKLSSEEYKKYIMYQLEYDSLSNILLEIRQIYDKLGLQVFSTIPEQPH